MLDTNVKILLGVLGLLILLSNLVDFQWLASKLLFKSGNTVVTPENKEKNFLEIVTLWCQLKHKCEQYKLSVASDKLDEVFPLLSGALEDEKTA